MPNAGKAVGERHARQAVAPFEGPPQNAGDAVGDRHARQTTAALEGPFSNSGDVVGDRYARQIAAVPEGIFPDSCDRFSVIGRRDRQCSRSSLFTISDGNGGSDDFIRQKIPINLCNTAEQQYTRRCKI